MTNGEKTKKTMTKDGKPTVIDSAYRVAKMNIRGDRLYTKKAKEFMRKKPYGGKDVKR